LNFCFVIKLRSPQAFGCQQAGIGFFPILDVCR
jgi:hypothetical protein